MKYLFTSFALALAGYLWFANKQHDQQEAEKSPEPSDYMYAQRSFPYGTVPSAAFYEALEFVQNQVADRGGSDITWESLGPDNVGGRVTDIAMHTSDQQTIYVATAIHPHNPDTVFAVTWERVRRQNMRRYGGPGCGIWRSFDGGENWTKLSVGLPSSNIGRIGIALSEKDPILYAIYADQTGFFKGIFKTNNLGKTNATSDAAPS